MNNTISRIIILALFITTAMTINAQKSDGFFRYNNNDYQDRDNITYSGVGNQPFGEKPVPVGSGLLVLAAAGAGYALMHRKGVKGIKGVNAIIIASVMFLGMTQCKKKIDNTVVDNGSKVHITVNVGNGSRHIIDPNESGYVPVRYEIGDVIYVGDGSQYIGTLTCTTGSNEDGNNATFSGDITQPNVDDALHFYFVGGLTPQNFGSGSAALATGETSFTVDISNQKDKLPVLSYTKVVYTGDNDLSCTLNNKCALVEFKYTPGTTEEVKVSNMLCEAKIDFATPGITPTGKLDAISLYSKSSTQKWAILLPGPQRYTMGMVFTKQTTCDSDTWNQFDYYDEVTVEELHCNDYKYGGDAVNIDISEAATNTDKVFVVSQNGNAVHLASSNLQYQATTQTWRFGEHPWSFVGDASQGNVYETIGGVATKCTNTLISDSYEGWIDLFGWGTWGSGNPCNTSTNDDDYTWTGDFNGELTNDNHTDWRTLTAEEWTALRHYINSPQRIGAGTINTVTGNILLPTYSNKEVFTYGDNKIFKAFNEVGGGVTNANTPSDTEWEAIWAPNGAVFLPRVGIRINSTTVNNANSRGYCWSSSLGINEDSATYFNIGGNNGVSVANNLNKKYGNAVRLAR